MLVSYLILYCRRRSGDLVVLSLERKRRYLYSVPVSLHNRLCYPYNRRVKFYGLVYATAELVNCFVSCQSLQYCTGSVVLLYFPVFRYSSMRLVSVVSGMRHSIRRFSRSNMSAASGSPRQSMKPLPRRPTGGIPFRSNRLAGSALYVRFITGASMCGIMFGSGYAWQSK